MIKIYKLTTIILTLILIFGIFQINVFALSKSENLLVFKANVIEVYKQPPDEAIKIKKSYKLKYNVRLEEKYQDLTFDLCEEYDLNYELILSWMCHESLYFQKLINHNRDRTTDYGYVMLNESCVEYHFNLIKNNLPSILVDINTFEDFNFTSDPEYQEHMIRLGIGLIKYFKDYYELQGINKNDLYVYAFNRYNMGREGYKKYRKKYGTIHKGYSDRIMWHYNYLMQHKKFKY